MSTSAWLQLAVFLGLLVVLAWPLGIWLTAVAEGRLPPWLAPLRAMERGLYRLAGVDESVGTGWRQYALALIVFNAIGVVAVYALQRLQGVLPLNPQGMAAVSADSSFNTAVSFVTNTDWQGYAGESTMSYLTQMLALSVQNFLSAATGIVVVMTLIRGFAARSMATIGNFWVDVTRVTAYVLLPLSLVFAVFLVSQGVIQNFSAFQDVTTLETTSYQQPKNGPDGQPLKDAKGAPVLEDMKTDKQTLAMGPVASQEAIKMLGTNGGGFFNANSAHPYENPTALTNFAQMLAIFLIPAALVFMLGRMVGDRRQAWAVLAAMTAIFVVAVVCVTIPEQTGNPVLSHLGADQSVTATQSGGNMEGKETRFGITASTLFAVVTTAASCGAVDGMHDSFTPLGGAVPLVLMQLGEVVFGGTGSGLYGMLIFAILAVFIAGLMIGRTPEYLGKKIEVYEMKMTSIAILVTPTLVLAGTAIAVLADAGKAGMANPGAHGFSEILYAFSSAGNNNGSAFAGLSANTPFWNTWLAIAMWLGRFAVIVPVLAIAGSLAAKKRMAVTSGTLPTHGPLFVSLLIGTVMLVGLLNYVPAIALGPVVEHLMLWSRSEPRQDNIMTTHQAFSLLDPALVRPAIASAFGKLDPRTQWRNPVMFVVYVGSILTTVLWLQALTGRGEAPQGFILAITLWLWFTVLFANFAEAMAEGRSKAQASSLRGMKKKTIAKKLDQPKHGSSWHPVESEELRKGAVVLVEAGDTIPLDGEVIEGVASVDESAITGESAPVIRESGGDFSSVTGGTRVLSDWLVVRIDVNPGESFLDRMIAMVEGAKRQKTPNEIALTILLVALTIVFLVVTVTLLPYSIFAVEANKLGTPVTVTALIALLVCLIPTTIGGLLSAIGVAGMSRMMAANVIATSGRAVEAAGDVDVLLLDKTGTITLGNRQASSFVPAQGVTEQVLADAAQFASMADETPEGRSITVLAKQKFNLRERDLSARKTVFVPFTAQTRMSGVDIEADDGSVRMLRKGAGEAIRKHVESLGGLFPADVQAATDDVARKGSTPLVVCDGRRVLGVVELKDIVKGGIKERFAELRRMGIKTVMITGDNRLTAAAIAAEAGVDDFLAEATPEAKLKMIRDYQAEGRLVAMTGDGTNDAPALAQADVAVAMNTGTQAAKEAGNMVDLDSNPTKLLEIVETGKQLLMTRGSLTTFSIANDIAKYFAIIPAIFVTTYPQLAALNVMGLASPASAILSAVVFNALVIVFLIPLALKGVAYRAIGAAALLRRNVLIYGVGGLIVPFVGIKVIDLALSSLMSSLHLV